MKSILSAIAAIASAAALFIASVSTGLCIFFLYYDEPEMPQSLLSKQR